MDSRHSPPSVSPFAPRPGTPPAARRRYQDPAECTALLAELPALNPDEAHRILGDMVSGLLQAMPPADAHLDFLEAARSPIALAQGELAQRYASHPLPPDSAEEQTLRAVAGLWRTLSRSYAHLARSSSGDEALDDRRATLAQRRVFCAGQVVLEYFRARRALPPGLWAELHDSYSAADGAGLSATRVPDPLNEIWKAQSAAEGYIAILLVDLANPYGRSERDFRWISRWAQRFAPYCTLLAESEGNPTKPASYGLDLSADHGLRPVGVITPSGSLRQLDGSQLAGQIQAVLKQLKQGVAPGSLGLGSDCTKETCSKLLLSLYRPWGLAAAGRRFPRRSCQGKAELCADWPSIAFQILGKPFEQPTTYATQRSLRSDIALLTFGEQVEQAAPRWTEEHRRRAAAKLGLRSEHWTLADHSVNGFRLTHRPESLRLSHHQLVGIRPPDGEYFLLAQISWLLFRGDGTMEAGVQVLAGIPTVAGVRSFGLRSSTSEPYLETFLLPATPALKAPESIVLPAGWYQPQRIVEIANGTDRFQIRLTGMLMRGPNFDQASYERLAG